MYSHRISLIKWQIYVRFVFSGGYLDIIWIRHVVRFVPQFYHLRHHAIINKSHHLWIKIYSHTSFIPRSLYIWYITLDMWWHVELCYVMSVYVRVWYRWWWWDGLALGKGLASHHNIMWSSSTKPAPVIHSHSQSFCALQTWSLDTACLQPQWIWITCGTYSL